MFWRYTHSHIEKIKETPTVFCHKCEIKDFYCPEHAELWSSTTIMPKCNQICNVHASDESNWKCI